MNDVDNDANIILFTNAAAVLYGALYKDPGLKHESTIRHVFTLRIYEHLQTDWKMRYANSYVRRPALRYFLVVITLIHKTDNLNMPIFFLILNINVFFTTNKGEITICFFYSEVNEWRKYSYGSAVLKPFSIYVTETLNLYHVNNIDRDLDFFDRRGLIIRSYNHR